MIVSYDKQKLMSIYLNDYSIFLKEEKEKNKQLEKDLDILQVKYTLLLNEYMKLKMGRN